MIPLVISIALCLSLLPGNLCTVTTVENQEVLEGQSVTIPCHYNPEYTQNVKYWCWGYSRSFCTTLARTDDPHSTPSSNARVTIIDDPTQQVFTVKMRELKEEDSGWYRCAVEVGSIWTADSTGNLYITVKHGMSVMNSTVSGEEGGSITVQVLYSLKHRENMKLWCRSGDLRSCQATNSSGIFSSSSLLISDDRKSMVTVTMSNLEMRDAGWYWLSSAGQKVPVQVLVTPRPITTSAPSLMKLIGLTTPCPGVAKAENSHWLQPVSLTVCGIVLLLILVAVVCYRSPHCKKSSRQQMLTEGENSLTRIPSIGVDWKVPLLFLKNTFVHQV